MEESIKIYVFIKVTILYKHRNVFRKLSLKEVDHFTKKQLLGKHPCTIRDLMQFFSIIIHPRIRRVLVLSCPTRNSETTQKKKKRKRQRKKNRKKNRKRS